jgi:ABC-type transporter Mla MlaB component
MHKQSSAKSRSATASEAAAPAGAAPIRLPADLGIEQAQALHGQLSAHLQDADKIVFDAQDVERIHTAALQLFCLFCRDRRTAGREVEFLRPSESLRNAAALLGATTLLNIARAQV